MARYGKKSRSFRRSRPKSFKKRGRRLRSYHSSRGGTRL